MLGIPYAEELALQPLPISAPHMPSNKRPRLSQHDTPGTAPNPSSTPGQQQQQQEQQQQQPHTGQHGRVVRVIRMHGLNALRNLDGEDGVDTGQ